MESQESWNLEWNLVRIFKIPESRTEFWPVADPSHILVLSILIDKLNSNRLWAQL